MENNEKTPVETHDAHHPSPAKYIQISIILTVITALEVAVYYVSWISKEGFIAIFIVMSAVKFLYVAMFYMHLKFDHSLFTWLFVAGFILATGILIALGALFGMFT